MAETDRAQQLREAQARHRAKVRGGPPRELQPCGTRASYKRGCRCEPCTAANTEHTNKYRKPTGDKQS